MTEVLTLRRGYKSSLARHAPHLVSYMLAGGVLENWNRYVYYITAELLSTYCKEVSYYLLRSAEAGYLIL